MNKPKITFISASAGSGKTYRVVEEVHRRLNNGTCQPGGLIATTFTIKSAGELKDRLRQKLYGSGQGILAERLSEAAIGTVDSVCAQILQRFAFEAGISPEIKIEEDSESLLSMATEAAADPEIIQRLLALASALSQKTREGVFTWKADVSRVIVLAQANDFAPEALPAMAAKSCVDLLALLPPPTTEDLDAALAVTLEQALQQIKGNGDETGVTATYSELLTTTQQRLAGGELQWVDWTRLANSAPGAKSRAAAAKVAAVAARYESHPRFQQQIKEYIELLFDLARQSMVRFSQLKRERGLLDFPDLEQLAYHLVRDNPQVRVQLKEELDLLVVDEFQDTSPLQLALFMQLADCAKEVVWVGDVKQAIYGFRNSDPELIEAVIAHVKKSGGLSEPLGISYRSLPDLVKLTNNLFVPAFGQSLSLPENQVRLEPSPEAKPPPAPQSAIQFLELSSGQYNKGNGNLKRLTADQFWTTLAAQIAQWFSAEPRLQVRDRASGLWRPLEPKDVAVLCRKNGDAATVAEKLGSHGLSVNVERTGLLATPEACFALACLRRLADPRDTLAAAEIIALSGSLNPEDWLAQRLEYLAALNKTDGGAHDLWGAEPPYLHAIVAALEAARPRLSVLTPAEALDLALAIADAPAIVSAWGSTNGQAAQRRANLEALRIACRNYEQSCAASLNPATIAGFFWWCQDNEGADAKALDPEAAAIKVVTYHGAKGLEWPVVVCTGLAAEPRPRIWGSVVEPGKPKVPFDLESPLANRTIRFWPWPFGQASSGNPLDARAADSVFGRRAREQAGKEDLRLLYVGLTRARDRLVLAWDSSQVQSWLEGLDAPWLKHTEAGLTLPGGQQLAIDHVVAQPPATAPFSEPVRQYAWFPPARPVTSKLPAQIIPSYQPAVGHWRIDEVVDLGGRLPLGKKCDEAALGDALHALLAAEMVQPNRPDRLDVATRILKGFDVHATLTVADALAMVDRFRKGVNEKFKPKSVLVEVPFQYANEAGQRVAGFMDLLLETESGWILVDHKSFPIAKKEWDAKALSYSGQLEIYKDALETSGRHCLALWIHFAVGGGLLEIDSSSEQNVKNS